ncbi:ParB N-terminal domain-containing protein [Caldisphaera sp.]|uniref:ParB N-terminal domain-containing protein n=1 Tax=Caldisphaera sp. TaxID=2060322 RepID=UPI0025C29B10|nr:ParB N-terminal domain-containing protein [Caldisphaera sp.]
METKDIEKVYIGLVNINDLKQHELAIDEHIEELKKLIVTQKIIRKPIIADIKTGTIIDGAHRTRALKSLGIKYIPAVLIDYINDDKINVDKWYRVYDIDYKDMISYLKSMLCFQDMEYYSNSIKIIMCNDNKVDSYMLINKFENEFKESIKEISFIKPEIKKVKRKGIIIDPPKLEKEDVINVALKQTLLPPRSTRHVTFLKKIYVNYSLKNIY